MANTASGKHVRRLLGGSIPQEVVDGLEESLAAASTDGLRIANAQTADYTLALSDLGKAVDVNSATAKNVTVPPNSTVAFPLGSIIEVSQVGAGAVSLVAGVGVTIEGSTTTPAQRGSLLLRKRATNTWTVTSLAPSGTLVQVPEHGTTIGAASLIADVPSISFDSVWGITAAGEPYYDADGAVDGEGAILSVVDGTVVLQDFIPSVLPPATPPVELTDYAVRAFAQLDPTTVVYDAMLTDGASLLTDSGHTAILVGKWPRVAGVMKNTSTAGGRTFTVDTGAADGYVESLVRLRAGAHPGLVIRGLADKQIVARYSDATGEMVLRLHESTTGAEQTIVVRAQLHLDLGLHTFAAWAVGREITVFVDGQVVIERYQLSDDDLALYDGTEWGLVSQSDPGNTDYLQWLFAPRDTPSPRGLAWRVRNSSETTRPALTTVLADVTETAQTEVRGMDRHGRLYGSKSGARPTMRFAVDGDPASFVDVTPDLPEARDVIEVIPLDDDELLVFARAAGQTAKVYKSVDWDPATNTVASWAEKIESSADSRFLERCIDHYKARVLVTEYSPQVRGYLASQKIWESLDYGDTFAVVFDATLEWDDGNWHLHGLCIDPWERAYYMCAAHLGIVQGIYRATWDEPTEWVRVHASEGPTTLKASRHGIIVGSDVGTADRRGVMLLDRATGELYDDFIFPVEDNMYWATSMTLRRSPEGIWLGAFRRYSTGDRGLVLASGDGRTWQEIWRDPLGDPAAGSHGPITVVGPTAAGLIVGRSLRESFPEIGFEGPLTIDSIMDPCSCR